MDIEALQSFLAECVCSVGNVGGNLHYSDCITSSTQGN